MSEIWPLPPKIKIYEALGALADGRLVISGDGGKLYSSSGNKFYTIKYDPRENAIMTNDNATYFVGYLGYPAITFLMQKGVISYPDRAAKALAGIAWKDINQKNKNDFDKTAEYAAEIAGGRGVSREELDAATDDIMSQLAKLRLTKLGPRIRPPKGY